MEREKSIEIENLQARWGWGSSSPGTTLESVHRQPWGTEGGRQGV